MEDDGPGREAEKQVDEEDLVRVMALLRDEHPRASERSLRRLVVWGDLRRRGETREEYAARMHGPLEPLFSDRPFEEAEEEVWGRTTYGQREDLTRALTRLKQVTRRALRWR